MSYGVEVVVYATKRGGDQAYRAYVKVRPKEGDPEVLSGAFGSTPEAARASSLQGLRMIIKAAKRLLEG